MGEAVPLSWFAPEPAARERVEGNPHRRVWVAHDDGRYVVEARIGKGASSKSTDAETIRARVTEIASSVIERLHQ